MVAFEEYKIDDNDLSELRQAVLDHNRQAAHYYYDKILHDLAAHTEPTLTQFLDAICYGETNERL